MGVVIASGDFSILGNQENKRAGSTIFGYGFPDTVILHDEGSYHFNSNSHSIPAPTT